MPNGMALDAHAARAACVVSGSAGAIGGGAIVMGLDQHRAQITAEWLDTATGEVGRARVAPGDRAGVRRFLARFSGRQLEVCLEARTGGGSWPGSWPRSARLRIWPSRRRRARCVATRSARRPTARMLAICVSC